MASAASPSRKRESSGNELDNGSSSKKKMKTAGQNEHHESKRSKSRSKKDIKAGLKTVTELAKLVTSGAVQVPKSLVNYASDKALLLDQVFTILSPSDINGMLPDILKGLKIKRVKSLCYEQLKGMTEDEVKRALQPEDSAAATSSPSEVRSLSSNQCQATPTVKETAVTIKKSGEEGKGETQVLLHQKDDVIKKDTCTLTERKAAQSQEDVLSMSKLVETKVTSKQDSDTTDLGRGKRDSVCDKLSSEGGMLDERQDVSKEVALSKKESNEAPQLMCAQQSKTSREENCRDSSQVKGDKNVSTLYTNMEALSKAQTSSGSEGSLKDEDDLNVAVSELDATQLLEMKMRRRALESELKKFSDNHTTTRTNRQSLQLSCSSTSEEVACLEVFVSDSDTLECEDEVDNIIDRQENSLPLKHHGDRILPPDGGSVDEIKVDRETMDIGELLEMKLREKALQSLLNKKKNSTQ